MKSIQLAFWTLCLAIAISVARADSFVPALLAQAASERNEQNTEKDKKNQDTGKKKAKEDKDKDKDKERREGVRCQFFGHSFVYLTSPGGVRIALNPYSKDAVGYEFPTGLPADIVLISVESADHSGGSQLSGLPQIFRSLTGEGVNRANGILFKGVRTHRNSERASNTSYVFTLDGMVFCHLGMVGDALTEKQLRMLGEVDVLFLPIGNKTLKEGQIWKFTEELKAKWIAPVYFKTNRTERMNLRAVEDLNLSARPARKVEGKEFLFLRRELPAEPTVLVFSAP